MLRLVQLKKKNQKMKKSFNKIFKKLIKGQESSSKRYLGIKVISIK